MGKLPVSMWIHGVGYREGFGFEPEMDGGEDWASRGVVLVSVTYRLGVIGFFSQPLLSAESQMVSQAPCSIPFNGKTKG